MSAPSIVLPQPSVVPVHLPQGFRCAGIHAGIKPETNRKDLSLFVSDVPSSGAGVFTLNKVCGAPVKVSRKRLPCSKIRGIVINSGNANACTGDKGMADAETITQLVAKELGCDAQQVLVCSTGVIGRFLPMEKFHQAIPQLPAALGSSSDHVEQAARSIMTTDTIPKFCHRQFEISGKTITITGIAKGAAMIAPNMATMLSVIMTDAPLTPVQTDQALRTAVNQSFNCISVEGHTSTSDSVLLLANGQCGLAALDAEELKVFQSQLNDVANDLSQKIIRDAEGANHFVTIEVTGLPTFADAKHLANTVANDALVKTAITGNDPNWGRIISACGRTGIALTERNISLKINGLAVFAQGAPTDHDVKVVSAAMKTGEVLIQLTFDLGQAGTRIWTSDLTAEYVHLNADYTT
jgi:glutamate N-acetyltransferase/amino-acid N-acetyltransferase